MGRSWAWPTAARRVAALLCAGAMASGCGGSLEQDVPDFGVEESVTSDVPECPNECDDGNPCTQDFCNSSGECQNIPSAGAACDDGNACTTGDQCDESGACLASGNLACDDSNTCTDDVCLPDVGCQFKAVPDGKECDDGNLCTTGESCVQGACKVGYVVQCEDDNADDCTFPTCKPLTGECNGAEFEAEDSPCKDGKACTDNDKCDAQGKCVGGTLHECNNAGDPCRTSACIPDAPEDTNPCKLGWKDPGVQCDDGDMCTDKDSCQWVVEGIKMKCTGTPLVCNDGNPCTSDSCKEGSGCQFKILSDGTPCKPDDSACSALGKCLAGQCQGAAGSFCDDGNPCTTDSCDDKTGKCIWESNSLPCDDGDSCTVNDACGGGACTGLPVDCSEVAVVCLLPICNPSTGKCDMPAEDGLPCLDEDLCNGAEVCFAGSCIPGTPVACEDDGNECTEDECDAATGKCGKAVPDGTPCGNDLCSDGDTCQTGLCVPGSPVECEDDGNPCTTDECNTEDGKCGILLEDGSSCQDGNLCTVADTCKNGECMAGSPVVCLDDGNPCTQDVCDPISGKCGVALPDGTQCGETNPCSGGAACQAGICSPGKPVVCTDDGNPCTQDECDPAFGKCGMALMDGTACSDGDPCTPTDTCQKGVCLGGGALACTDANVCTDDSCVPGKGCQYLPNSVACDDGNKCTVTDKCSGGICVGAGQPDCSDGNDCTDDSCKPATGCSFAAVLDGTSCGVLAGWKCSKGVCKCALSCMGKQCGDDGCGGTCGQCPAGLECIDGACLCKTAPKVSWDKTFGGTGPDHLRSIAVRADGGVVLGGYTKSKGAGGDDGWLLRIDASGGLLWDKTLGGPGEEQLRGVAALADGSIAVAGTTTTYLDYTDGMAARYSDAGALLWNWTLGQSGAFEENLISVVQTPKGDIAFVGSRTASPGNMDAWLVERSLSGSAVTDKSYGGSGSERLYAIATTLDGGLATSGYHLSPTTGNADGWLLALDAVRAVALDKGFGETGGLSPLATEVFSEVVPMSDGGYALSGMVFYNSQFPRVIRTDGSGLVVWEVQFGNLTAVGEAHLAAMPDGGFVMATSKAFGDGSGDAYLVRLDKNGNQIWETTVGQDGGEYVWDLAALKEGGLAVAGSTNKKGAGSVDGWVLVMKPECDTCLPSCGGKQCGPDGCGGSCGSCDDGNDCTKDTCSALSLCEHVADPFFCTNYFYDSDGDGFGVDGNTKCLCEPWSKYSAPQGGDCDDGDSNVHPAGHKCGVDGDCDGNLLDTGEQCDDGNGADWDGCRVCNVAEVQVSGPGFCWNGGSGVAFGSATALPDGGFAAVWNCSSFSYQEGVLGSLFGPDGTILLEQFTVSKPTNVKPYRPAVASFADGRFVVIWERADESYSGIYGRRFLADGSALGGEFQVNATTFQEQSHPCVASLPGGGFVVAWHDGWWNSGDGYEVMLQLFDATGNKVGGEVQVNSYTQGLQEECSIAASPGGDFMVVWQSQEQDGSGRGVFGQRYSPAAQKLGSEFLVNTSVLGDQDYPKVAARAGVGFVVVWTVGGGPSGLRAQLFDASGTKLGKEIVVGGEDAANEIAVSGTADGGFVAAWPLKWVKDQVTLVAQRFDPLGQQTGGPFPINTLRKTQAGILSAAALEGGNLVFLWRAGQDELGESGVFAQRFDASGNKLYH